MNNEAIRLHCVASFEDCRVASRIAFTRSQIYSQWVPSLVMMCILVCGMVAGLNLHTQVIAIIFWVFFDAGALYAILLAFVAWNAFVARPKSLWSVAQAMPLDTIFVFDTSSISASNSYQSFEHDWSAYDRYIEVREGVLLIYKSKATQFFPKRQISDSYDAFLERLRRQLPSTKYLNEKLKTIAP